MTCQMPGQKCIVDPALGETAELSCQSVYGACICHESMNTKEQLPKFTEEQLHKR